jgi:hypothetical protein
MAEVLAKMGTLKKAPHIPTKLKQHKYYVYSEENRVMARMDALEPVVAEECHGGALDEDGLPKSPAQEAADKVQAILNPEGRKHSFFGKKGFLEESFQKSISTNCEAYVKAAYKAAAKD